MPRDIPLKAVKTKNTSAKKPESPEADHEPEVEVSPYDIILENVELSYEKIPKFIKILKNYQDECEKEARYMEAEVAKHRINDMKYYMTEFKKEIIRNYHLKEHCEVEEAYIAEFNNFNQFWENKMQEFSENSNRIELEFAGKQQARGEEFDDRLTNDDKIKKNCITNDVLNLQKIEQTLARQKNYIEAQRTRIEWQKKIKSNFIRFKDEADKQKLVLLDEFEKKQSKEIVEFKKKIEDLHDEQEKTRKNELERLVLKYEKIKKDLNNIQDSERKAIDKDLPIMLNDTAGTGMMDTAKTLGHEKKMNTFAEKKKVLLSKISKLDYFPQN